MEPTPPPRPAESPFILEKHYKNGAARAVPQGRYSLACHLRPCPYYVLTICVSLSTWDCLCIGLFVSLFLLSVFSPFFFSFFSDSDDERAENTNPSMVQIGRRVSVEKNNT